MAEVGGRVPLHRLEAGVADDGLRLVRRQRPVQEGGHPPHHGRPFLVQLLVRHVQHRVRVLLVAPHVRSVRPVERLAAQEALPELGERAAVRVRVEQSAEVVQRDADVARVAADVQQPGAAGEHTPRQQVVRQVRLDEARVGRLVQRRHHHLVAHRRQVQQRAAVLDGHASATLRPGLGVHHAPDELLQPGGARLGRAGYDHIGRPASVPGPVVHTVNLQVKPEQSDAAVAVRSVGGVLVVGVQAAEAPSLLAAH